MIVNLDVDVHTETCNHWKTPRTMQKNQQPTESQKNT